MSFSFSFYAKDAYSARGKLNAVNAPASVKAVIESALASMRPPAPNPTPDTAAKAIAGSSGLSSSLLGSSSKSPVFVGVFVEAWGHIADDGIGTSEIQRFVVRPLFD